MDCDEWRTGCGPHLVRTTRFYPGHWSVNVPRSLRKTAIDLRAPIASPGLLRSSRCLVSSAFKHYVYCLQTTNWKVYPKPGLSSPSAWLRVMARSSKKKFNATSWYCMLSYLRSRDWLLMADCWEQGPRCLVTRHSVRTWAYSGTNLSHLRGMALIALSHVLQENNSLGWLCICARLNSGCGNLPSRNSREVKLKKKYCR